MNNPKTWLASVILLCALVAVVVGFSWNGGTSQPGDRSADIRHETERLNRPGSSGGTNGEAPR
jgi:hypothetical protein